MNQKIIKGITLIVFSSLIIGFVSYKSGYLDKKISSNSIPSEQDKPFINDTLPTIDSTRQFRLMHSSKSIIMREHTKKPINSNENQIDAVLKRENIMYSSKSGIIINSADLISLDSISPDSLLKQ